MKQKIVEWLVLNADFSSADLKHKTDTDLIYYLNDWYPGGAIQFLVDSLKEGGPLE